MIHLFLTHRLVTYRSFTFDEDYDSLDYVIKFYQKFHFYDYYKRYLKKNTVYEVT